MQLIPVVEAMSNMFLMKMMFIMAAGVVCDIRTGSNRHRNDANIVGASKIVDVKRRSGDMDERGEMDKRDASGDSIQVKERPLLPEDQADSRLTLRLSPEARETLEWLAEERHITFGEVIRRALGTERFFYEATKRNASILLEESGSKRLKEVLLR
jgi:hypothetical protein